MSSILTFEDILIKLNMRHEKFIYSFSIWIDKSFSKTDIFKIKVFYEEKALKKIHNNNYEFNDLLEESFKSEDTQILHELEVINYKAIAVLAQEYFNLIINKYYINVEDLSRFLDVEIQYCQKNIVGEIDRLSFPPSKIKQLMKQQIYLMFLNEENLNDYYNLKETFIDLMRKKILLDKNTTYKYLNTHMQQCEGYQILNLKLNKQQFESLEMYKSINEIEAAFNKIVKSFKVSDQDKFEYDSKKGDRFYSFMEDFFMIKTDKNIDIDVEASTENRKFYSIATMRAKFEKVYDVEVLRELKSIEYTKYSLSNNIYQKKPSMRYLIDINFIKDILKEVYDLKEIEKENDSNCLNIDIQVPDYKFYYIIKNISNIEDYFIQESLKLYDDLKNK